MLDPLATVYPEESPLTRFNGLRISSRIIPAAGAPRGGDWCDAFSIDDDVLAISIGDVCGHGVEKFDSMVAVRQAIRDAAFRNLDPAQTLAHVNWFRHERDPGEIVTAIVGLLDTRRRLIVFYTDGVSESTRDAVQGSIQLCAAAKFVRDFPELPTATTIEAMTLSARNFDDVAIMTVRTPLFPILRSSRSKRYAAGAAH